MIIFDVLFNVLISITLWFVVLVTVLVLVYGHEFKRLWLEPMLRYPVIIFESDDWGVGPEEQTAILADIVQLFLQYRDQRRHYPVLTLGMILAEPDIERINVDKSHYYSRDLSDQKYQDLVQGIKKGQQQKIIAIHLHGMEHFWPQSLMNQIQRDDVRQWLSDSVPENETGVRSTEHLPSFLQSRWCDTSTLPSEPLKEQDIARAVAEEVKCFYKVFAQLPKVLVPPTFVWTDQVIKHYLLQNVSIFITPGKQFTGRDADGVLQANNRTFYNGDSEPETDALYLVRDVYFEPDMGHKAERVLTDIIKRANFARPALVEMHRFNFLSDKQHSLSELKSLLDIISKQLPQTLFLSVEELARVFYAKDTEFLLVSFSDCFRIWQQRVRLFLSHKRLAKYTAFNKLLNALCGDYNK